MITPRAGPVKEEVMDLQLEPGAEVWVVERDEDDAVCAVYSYMFLAEVDAFIIASPYVNGIEHLEGILAYHARETVRNYDPELAVFHTGDCFATREAALAARDAQGWNTWREHTRKCFDTLSALLFDDLKGRDVAEESIQAEGRQHMERRTANGEV